MEYIVRALLVKKVVISFVFLILVVLFTYALYNSETVISATGNVIKELAGK